MTDQKHTKETLKIGDKAWVEMVVIDVDENEGVAFVAHSSTANGWPKWVGMEGSWISQESPLDLRKQLNELRNACSILHDIKWWLENSNMDLSDISQFTDEIYHACDVLTKTKGDV